MAVHFCRNNNKKKSIECLLNKNGRQIFIHFLFCFLTVIIRIAENVLFDVFVLSGVMIVFEPHGHGEISRQVVRHHFRRHGHACCTVKHENLASSSSSSSIG